MQKIVWIAHCAIKIQVYQGYHVQYNFEYHSDFNRFCYQETCVYISWCVIRSKLNCRHSLLLSICVKETLKVLEEEMKTVPAYEEIVLADASYRKNLVCSLFYKVWFMKSVLSILLGWYYKYSIMIWYIFCCV